MRRPDFKRRVVLFPAMSNNGRLVHLATRFGMTCNPSADVNRVHGRVTCARCRLRHPGAARRHDGKPLVTGLDWSPLYAAIGGALCRGETEAPEIRVPCWPRLASPDPSGSAVDR